MALRILVANDDGIHSPGIAALARVASRFGDVHVVAPDVEQSSASHAITAARPLTYRSAAYIPGVEAWRVNGTPADCVALGMHHWGRVDVVLSGINQGTNLGNAIWHSGTLAAANDAEFQGALATLLRGAASRNQIDRTVDADGAARWIAAIIDGIFSRVAVDPGFKPKDEGAMLRLLLTRFLRPQG